MKYPNSGLDAFLDISVLIRLNIFFKNLCFISVFMIKFSPKVRYEILTQRVFSVIY